MINKKFFILSIFLIAILSISVVSAEDSMDSVASADDSVVLEESVDDSAIQDENIDESAIQEETIDDPVVLEESVDDSAIPDENIDIIDENIEKEENVEIEAIDSDDVNLDDVEEELVSDKQPKNTLKYIYGYVTPVTAQYGSDETVSLGWNGYIDGNFKVYKRNSVVFNYALSGLNKDYTYRVSGLKVGTYYAKLISDTYGVLDSAKVVIKKATTKISVKSFSAYAKDKVYCYAYVTLKSNGNNLTGKYVKFRIAGKTYKAKLKSGVACLYFKVPKKVKTYTCKAIFPGSKNTKKSSTKFKLKVKKSDLRSKTMKLKRNKYSTKKGYGGDELVVYYSTVSGQYSKGVHVEAMRYGGDAYYTKITQIKVYFKNKRTGKIITKSKKASYNWASVGLKKGYTPYKVKVYYRHK